MERLRIGNTAYLFEIQEESDGRNFLCSLDGRRVSQLPDCFIPDEGNEIWTEAFRFRRDSMTAMSMRRRIS